MGNQTEEVTIIKTKTEVPEKKETEVVKTETTTETVVTEED